jgi:predicted GNAT family N-acyltransferase
MAAETPRAVDVHSDAAPAHAAAAEIEVVEIAFSDRVGMEAIYRIRDEVFVDEQSLTDDARHDPDDAVSVHYLATQAGDPVGTGRLTMYHREAQIAWVAVRRPLRGSGIGNALMEAMLQRGWAEGGTYALLNAQTHAQSFYDRLGFEPVGGVFHMGGIPHIVMVKRLDEVDPGGPHADATL